MKLCIPIHSVRLTSMTKPDGHEQLDPVGLAALSRHMEEQFLSSHELFTIKDFQLAKGYKYFKEKVKIILVISR